MSAYVPKMRPDLEIIGFAVTAGTDARNWKAECPACGWRRADTWLGCQEGAFSHLKLNTNRNPHIRALP